MPSRLRPPRALLLDVGGTILEERRYDLDAGIAAVVGARATAGALARAFREDAAARHRLDRELPLAAWLRARVPALAAVAPPAIEDAIWPAVVTLVPRPGALALLRRLARDGVPVAAVSNAAFSGRVLAAELARHGLAGSLRLVLSSADVGVRKPGVAIFAAALARLGTTAPGTWFVGDTPGEDVAGAVAAGLQPVWLSNGAPAAPELDGVPAVRDWAELAALYDAARRSAPAG